MNMALISLFNIVINYWATALACSACLTVLIFQAQRRLVNVLDKLPLIGIELGNAEQRRKAYVDNARGLFKDGYQRVGTESCLMMYLFS